MEVLFEIKRAKNSGTRCICSNSHPGNSNKLLTKALWSKSFVFFFSSNSTLTDIIAFVTSEAAAEADSSKAISFLKDYLADLLENLWTTTLELSEEGSLVIYALKNIGSFTEGRIK